MMRSAVGSWVLILVCTGVVAASVVLGPGLPGAAVRAAPPTPPAIGSCTVGYPDPVLSSCATEHAGEVVLSWTGELPDTVLDPLQYPPESFPADDPDSHCWSAARQYLGESEPVDITAGITWNWTLPSWEVMLVHGPGSPVVPEWSWAACVLVALEPGRLPAQSTASMRGVASAPLAGRHSSWRTCTSPVTWSAETVPCRTPHRAELIAQGAVLMPEAEVAQIDRAQDAAASFASFSHPVAEADCRTLIETYLGTPLDTYAGELEAALVYQGRFVYDVAATGSTVKSGIGVGCQVKVVDDRTLAESVAGIGGGPLPWD